MHERTPAARIARGEQRVADRDDEAVRAFDAAQRLGELVLGTARSGERAMRCTRTSESIDRRRRSRPDSSSSRRSSVALMRLPLCASAMWPSREAREHRLRVLDRRRARRAVARVADRDAAVQRRDLASHRALGDEPHAANGARPPVIVDGDDARRLLPAMLQRVQAEMHELRRHRCMPRTPNIPHMSRPPVVRMLLEYRRFATHALHDRRNRVVIRARELVERQRA